MGPQPGMVTPAEMARVAGSLCAAEGIMVTPGIVRFCEDAFVGRDRPSLVVLIHWQNISRSREQLGYTEGATALIRSVGEAAAAGADAVMTYLYIGFEDPALEARQIELNSLVNGECLRLGIVHLVESRAVRNERLPGGTFDPEILKLHTRMAAELGADLVKTKYSGSVESFQAVVEQCPVPLLVAGGPRMDSLPSALQVAEEAVAAGGAGLVFGRNIYQQADPAAALEAFRQIVHFGKRAREVVA